MSSAFVPPLGGEYSAAELTGTYTLRADALRAQVESALGERFAGALTPAPRQVCETTPTGIEALDQMLGGGLPLGAITELVGPLSSGRTGVALRTVAAAMREGNMCAWVDASDAFDPESAAGNGVRLEQLLWVRCGVEPVASVGQGEHASVPGTKTQQGSERNPAMQARAGQHPRDEVRGLDTAVGALLREDVDVRRDRSIGTPGAPNRALTLSADAKSQRRTASIAAAQSSPPQARSFRPVPREEQVSSDRQPKRGRGDAACGLNHVDTGQRRQAERTVVLPAANAGKRQAIAKPWSRLDQALRAADLLLQAGGFRVLVLDLGSIRPEHALRIPLASWFRFRAAADAQRTLLLALTQTSCARSSAGLVISFGELAVQVDPGSGVMAETGAARALQLVTSQARVSASLDKNSAKVIESIRYQARPLRQRFTPSEPRPSTVSIDREARRQPQATWQFCAYPLRDALGKEPA